MFPSKNAGLHCLAELLGVNISVISFLLLMDDSFQIRVMSLSRSVLSPINHSEDQYAGQVQMP